MVRSMATIGIRSVSSAAHLGQAKVMATPESGAQSCLIKSALVTNVEKHLCTILSMCFCWIYPDIRLAKAHYEDIKVNCWHKVYLFHPKD